MTRWAEQKAWLTKNSNVLFFVGGFLFDVVTLVRIDSTLDLVYQSVYLGLISLLLIKQEQLDSGHWEPKGFIAKIWHYETEAIHFFYGGLLSAYVIFYFKSTTGSRSLIFLLLTILLMFANEMPQVKEAGSRMRLGLHTFCSVSFFNYLIPILFGRMGWWTFTLAVLLSGLFSIWLVRFVSRLTPDDLFRPWRIGWPPALVLGLVVGLYVMKWIPPVPLSMQYAGIFHKIERVEGQYELTYPKPTWYRFWKKDSRPFKARPGDVAYCFVRVFAPRRFTHQIFMQWSVRGSSGRYQLADRIPLPIYGGRGEGYRGYGAKSNYTPGDWRVEITTEDGRVIGKIAFVIEADASTQERSWRQRRM